MACYRSLGAALVSLSLACGVPPASGGGGRSPARDAGADAGPETPSCDPLGNWAIERTWTGGDCDLPETARRNTFTITMSGDGSFLINNSTPGLTVDGVILDEAGSCRISLNVVYDQQITDPEGNQIRLVGSESMNITETEGVVAGNGSLELTVQGNGAPVSCDKQYSVTGTKNAALPPQDAGPTRDASTTQDAGVPRDSGSSPSQDAGAPQDVCDATGTWWIRRTWIAGDCEMLPEDEISTFTITLDQNGDYVLDPGHPDIELVGQIIDQAGDCRFSARLSVALEFEEDGIDYIAETAESINLTESSGNITGSGEFTQDIVTFDGDLVDRCTKQSSIIGTKR